MTTAHHISSTALAGEGDHRKAMVEGETTNPLRLAALATSPAEAGEETNIWNIAPVAQKKMLTPSRQRTKRLQPFGTAGARSDVTLALRAGVPALTPWRSSRLGVSHPFFLRLRAPSRLRVKPFFSTQHTDESPQ
jgi:hypothetical protein